MKLSDDSEVRVASEVLPAAKLSADANTIYLRFDIFAVANYIYPLCGCDMSAKADE